MQKTYQRTSRSPRELAELLLFALENSSEKQSGSISVETLAEMVASDDDMVFDFTQNLVDWLKRNARTLSTIFMAFNMNALIGIPSTDEDPNKLRERSHGRVLAARLLLFQAEHLHEVLNSDAQHKAEARARALAKLNDEDRQALGLE